MHVLRDLTDKEDSAGALQRTIIDRILSLLPKEAASTGTKRKRVTSASRKVKEELDDYAEAITASERPQRAKTPSAKAKESGGLPKKKARRSAPSRMPEPSGQS